MAKKRIELIWEFLKAARNLVKNKDMSKEGILRFAKQQFGEVDDFLRLQINNLFRKPKVISPVDAAYKKELRRLEGALGSLDPKQPGFKQAANELVEKITKLQKDYKAGKFVPKEKADVVPIKEGEGIISTKEAFEHLKKTDPKGAKVFDDEAARINKEIEAREALEKRTKDIAKGDVEGEGIESLETSIKELKKKTEELKKITKESKITPESMFEDMFKTQKIMSEGYKTGNIRTAVREFMRSEEKAGRLKLNETDSFRIREYSPMTEDDPIDVFRRYYGEDALEAVDEIGDVFQRGESFKHYEELLRENVDSKFLTVKKIGAGDYDPNVVSAEKIRKAKEQEAKQRKILEDFDIDSDREPNAYGGIAGQLHLNRTGYKIGGGIKAFKLAKEIRQSKGYKDFIEALFIKASNMIRQGKGIFKNLDESQRIKQHDNLTKEVTNFQKTGELPEGAHQYFGMNPEVAYAETLQKVQRTEALKKWSPGTDRLPNAHGGLINILKL